MNRSSIVVAGVLALAAAGPGGAQQHTLIALSHSNHTAYEVDPSTGEVLHEFQAQDQPHEGIVTPDGRTIFLAVPNGPHVVVLDASTFEQRGLIESDYFTRSDGGPASPHGLALNHDGSKLYVGLERADIPGLVVYDVRRGQVTEKIDLLLEGGHFLAIDPRTDKLYYPHRTDNRVVVLDTRTDRILKIIPVEGGPVGVAFAPGEAWIHSDYDGSVSVIDTDKDEVVAVIQTQGRGAGRIAVSPDGRYAASTHGTTQDVAIIDTSLKRVVATVPLGPGPGFPLFSPASDKLYVENSGGGDVVVVDLATMTEVARYDVGEDPFGGDIRYLDGKKGTR